MKKSVLASFGSTLLVPALTFAQDTSYVDFWIGRGKGWLSMALTIIMVLMTLFFLWSVFKYVSEKDAGKLPEHRKRIWNGLIGLFIAVAVWGIVNIAARTLGTDVRNTTPGLTCPPGSFYNYVTHVCNVQ